MSIQHYDTDDDDINLKYVNDQRIDSLTTVLGIRSKDGVLLASDSKISSRYVKDKASKIFRINRSIGVAVSGDLGHIRILLDKLNNSLIKLKTFTELTLRFEIDDKIVCPLFKEYNVERARKIAGTRPI